MFPDFMSELLSSWGASSRASLPRTNLANLEGALAYGVATAPRVRPAFAMLAGATVRVGCEASHPNSRCRATDGRLCKAYNDVGRCGSGGRAVVWQSEGCRFDPTLGVSKCP